MLETGFGKTLGSIGIVIVLGSIIAEALRHTGGVQVILNDYGSITTEIPRHKSSSPEAERRRVADLCRPQLL